MLFIQWYTMLQSTARHLWWLRECIHRIGAYVFASAYNIKRDCSMIQNTSSKPGYICNWSRPQNQLYIYISCSFHIIGHIDDELPKLKKEARETPSYSRSILVNWVPQANAITANASMLKTKTAADLHGLACRRTRATASFRPFLAALSSSMLGQVR